MSFPSSDSEIAFDTYEVDYRIFKDGEFIQKSEFNPSINNKFKLIQGLTQEELEKKEENSEYPKYFSTISTKNFDYIGILSNQLKRDKYGYSKMEKEHSDEYLGEYKNELRDGFGIYKFNSDNDEDIKEIYIGNYKNNKKEGEGMYLKISKSIKEGSSVNDILINYNSGIGTFESDIFKNGKIFNCKDGVQILYQGKLNEIGEPEDDDAIIYEEDNKIFRGKVSKGDMIEGRNIILNEKLEKVNSYYFTKIDGKYDFDYFKKEEIDEDCIKKLKENPIQNYGKNIQNIFNEINNAFNKFKDYDTAIRIDFEKDIKNKIKNEIDKIIKE
jgi:hypothetical protein